MTDDLQPTDSEQLAECERIIDDGFATFLRVGIALAKVRDAKLYRSDYATFEDYCDKRWHLSRTRAYELMSAAQISEAVSEISDIPIATESHAKQLRGLDPTQAAEVVEKAAETGSVTAKSLAEAREEVAPNPAKVTQTTRVSEATKIERDVDLDTGEIVDDSPAAVIAQAKEELKTDPLILAQKAIERLADARKTIEAAGGVEAIEAALQRGDSLIDPQFWLTTLTTSIDVFSDLNSRVRRRNLRSV